MNWFLGSYILQDFQAILSKLVLKPLSPFEIIALIKLVIVSIFIFFTGYLLTRLLMRKGLKLNFLEMIGTSYFLGFGVIPFITLLFSVFSIEFQWLFLFVSILAVDIVLFSLTFPESISVNELKTVLKNFGRRILNNKDTVLFFLIVYTFVFSLVLLPLLRGVYMGIRFDAWRYAIIAENIMQGKSPFSTEQIYFEEYTTISQGPPITYTYTLFYILMLVSLTVLSGIGDVKTVSYLFAPAFSISGLPLTTYILLNQFKNAKSLDRSVIKLGVFAVIFISEEIIFWSLWGKGNVVAISYILLSLNFFIRMLRRTNMNDLIKQKGVKTPFNAILAGFFAGVACLYHITAFLLVDIIVFFLIIEVLFFRKEIKRILIPVGVFLSISILIALIYWIPHLTLNYYLPQTSSPQDSSYKWTYLFVEADIIQRVLYPFLFHYVPFIYPDAPIVHRYLFFGYGTAILFVSAFISVIINRKWVHNIEHRLLVASFILSYLFPLHPIVTVTFHFVPNRFVIFLELFSSLLIIYSLSSEHIKRYRILFIILWCIMLFLTLRWFSYALFYS